MITVLDPEPMMSTDNIFPKLAGSHFYSTFNCWLREVYGYTTFVSSRGLMRFTVMPYGLVNSGSMYNRMVRKLLDGTQNPESYANQGRREPARAP